MLSVSCIIRFVVCSCFLHVLFHCVVFRVYVLSLLSTSVSLIFLFLFIAVIGMSGHSILSVGSFSIRCQCFFSICPMLVVLLLYCVLNVSGICLFVMSSFRF